jgi:iron(III) transport system substrate-binding protein
MARLVALLATLALAGSAFALDLVIYNAGSSELIEATIDAFNEAHPEVNVTAVSAGVGQHTTRIEAEAGNPGGDVFFGASVESFEAIIQFFEPYRALHHDEYDPVFVHPETRYYGYSQPLQAFVVNANLLAEGERPTSWADLADPRFEGKIIMANPSLSGSAYAQLAQMLQLYDWDLVERVVANTTFVSSSQLVFENVARGEIEIGITGEANVAQLIADGWPVVAVYPSEGTGLRFDAMGIIAGGPNPEAARIFMDWATGIENHEIAAAFFRRSVRADATAPAGLAPTTEVPTFPYDADLAAANREDDLAKFDELLSAR